MNTRFLELIEISIKEHWELPALTDYNGNTFYYKNIAEEIAKLHILFKHANIQKGDKIALIGRNSSHWAISFFGILSYGAVAVPILHDFNAQNVHHIVNHSEAKILLVASHNWESLNVEAMPDVIFFIALENWFVLNSRKPEITKIQEQINVYFFQQYPDSFTKEHVKYHTEKPYDLAILNYTSGTTGFSKGVMVPFRSLWSNTQFAADRLPFIHSGDHFVSMLPMAHMYGLAFEILNGINKGCHIHFLPRVPNPKSVIESFATIRPALIIAVPLILEKIIRNNIFPILEKPKMKFFYKLPIIKQIIKKKILAKLNAAFGNNFFELIIGGAAINKEIETFLRSIGFRYTVGYGMTECGPLVTYEQWDTFKQGSVGRVVDRMEIKIESTDPEHEAGEIMVCGMNNMLGYYKNPNATAEVLMPDGWMRTGDLGTIDKDGFLFIRGRSKAMILSSNGQNIYPEEIESLLNNLPYVTESLVVKHQEILLALIYPSWEQANKDGLSQKELETIMNKNVATLNHNIPKYCKIAKIQLQQENFEKTPKQSIKRYLYQEEK